MTSDTIRLDVEVPESEFEELKEFVDEWKDVRRDSKRWYGRKFFEMAQNWKEIREEQLRSEARDYRDVEKRIKQVLQEE